MLDKQIVVKTIKVQLLCGLFWGKHAVFDLINSAQSGGCRQLFLFGVFLRVA